MDIYSALSDPTRRNIIELLANNGMLSVTDISNNFRMSQPAISQHLKALREAKLVDMEKKAQQRLYTLNTNTFQELEEWARKMKTLGNERFDRLENVLRELKRKEVKYGRKK